MCFDLEASLADREVCCIGLLILFDKIFLYGLLTIFIYRSA